MSTFTLLHIKNEITWKNMKLDMKNDIHVNLVEKDLWKVYIL
ncbi:hypothetical protein MC28_F271 (plasmid) [Bacillus thuringiensis MC28]|nr:hypothetical protein MC28_F271 [Bacillus thuringiensis MC28]